MRLNERTIDERHNVNTKSICLENALRYAHECGRSRAEVNKFLQLSRQVTQFIKLICEQPSFCLTFTFGPKWRWERCSMKGNMKIGVGFSLSERQHTRASFTRVLCVYCVTLRERERASVSISHNSAHLQLKSVIASKMGVAISPKSPLSNAFVSRRAL
jgi:hypothetical protein